MSEGARFGGHGSWSGYLVKNGFRKAGSPVAVSGYILERRLIKTIKEEVDSEVLSNIAEKYNLVKLSRGMDITAKIKERIDFIRLRVERMTTGKLQEAFDVYDDMGIIECLIFINHNRPIISQNYISRSTRNI